MVRHPRQLLENNHEYANSFTPLRLGAIKAPNRLVMAPLTRMRGSAVYKCIGLRPAQSRNPIRGGVSEASAKRCNYSIGTR
jgi:hypothetical protein